MKHLIRLMLLAVAILAGSTVASAQQQRCPDEAKRQQFVAKQAAHIAEKVGLDDTQRARFIDTYTAQQREMWTQCPPPQRRGHQHCNMTEGQTDSMMQARFEHNQKMLDLRRKYHAIYSEFMTAKQIDRFYELERQMMDRLRKRHEGRKDKAKAPQGEQRGQRQQRGQR